MNYTRARPHAHADIRVTSVAATTATSYYTTSICTLFTTSLFTRDLAPTSPSVAQPTLHIREGPHTEKIAKCVRPYATASSALTSACQCYFPAGSTSTYTEHSTTTLSNAPTRHITPSITLGTVTATPTCSVSATDPSSGATAVWTEYYHICKGSRFGSSSGYGSPPANATACDALEQCAVTAT